MDKKTLALVSYITIIGWLISFFSYKDKEKDSFVAYHLKQSFGLFITEVVLGIIVRIIIVIVAMVSVNLASVIGLIFSLVWLVILILMIIGIINANKGEEKPLPIIGKMFEGKFNFIS